MRQDRVVGFEASEEGAEGADVGEEGALDDAGGVAEEGVDVFLDVGLKLLETRVVSSLPGFHQFHRKGRRQGRTS